MALTEKLELLISADPSQGISAFKDFADKTDKALSSVESRIAKFGSTAMKIGAAGMGVGGFLTAMASDDIEASNQLKAAISGVGQSIEDYQDRIDSAAEAQVKFGYTDDQVNTALRHLVVSYGDTGKALDEMQLVADLAAFKHISLADAAAQVAKAHGGAGRLFKEFGVEVEENRKGAKDYDAALQQVATRLSGQAAASADTFGGRLRELRAEVSNMVSQFGQEYGPAILGVSTVLSGVGAVVQPLASGFGRLRESHRNAANAARELAEAQAANFSNSRSSVESLYAQEKGASKLTKTLGAAGLVGSVVAVGFAVGEFGSSLNDLNGTMDETAATAARLGDQELRSLFDTLMALSDSNAFGDMAQGVIDRLKDMGAEGVGVLQRLSDMYHAAGIDASQIDAAIAAAKGNQDNLNASTEKGKETLGQTADKANAFKEALLGAKHHSQDVAHWFEAIADNAERSNEAALKLAPADIRVQQGQLNVEQSKRDIELAENKVKWLKAAKAPAEDIADAERDLSGAQLHAQQTALDLAEAQTELAKTQAEANRGTLEGKDYNDKFVTSLQGIAEQYDGPIAEALRGFIWNAALATNAQKALNEAQNAMFPAYQATIAGTSGIAAAYDMQQNSRSWWQPPRRAAGGSVMANQWYQVNENQQEFFRPWVDGYVIPSASQAASSASVSPMQSVDRTEITIVHPDAFGAADETARALNRRRILEGV